MVFMSCVQEEYQCIAGVCNIWNRDLNSEEAKCHVDVVLRVLEVHTRIKDQNHSPPTPHRKLQKSVETIDV